MAKCIGQETNSVYWPGD